MSIPLRQFLLTRFQMKDSYFCLLTTCLVLFISVGLKGQNSIQPLTDLQIFGTSSFEFRNRALNLKDIQGSPYLDDEFSEGKLQMGNVLYDSVLLRYNVYVDRFEVRLEKNTIELDPVSNNIDTLYYSGQKFVRKFLQSDKNRELSHMAVVFDHPRCTLYKKYKLALIPEKKPGAYTSAQPAKFDPVQPDYYLGKGEDLVFLKGVKTFALFFDVDPGEVKSLVKSNRIKLQDEKDLVTLCSLLSEQ